MPWPDRAHLLEALRQNERHIIDGAERIARQREIIKRLESSGHGDSTMAQTAQALLESLELAQRGYIAERERIMGLLAR